MTAQEFVQLMALLNTEQKAFQLGTVAAGHVSGKPRIVFDIDETGDASSKTFPYLAGQTFTSGDRVLIANINGSHVILGKIVK
jgi:hypothetical protein